MDKPSIILEWIAASEAVFTQLENCSKHEPLTQPHKFWKKSTNIVLTYKRRRPNENYKLKVGSRALQE